MSAALRVAAALASALAAASASAQQYRFPSSDAHAHYFYPTAYKDHAGKDWHCGTLRYDGHQGSDYGAGGFAGMDAGRDVAAAARGVVIETHDGEFDRCTTGDCPGGGVYGNHVVLLHPDGKQTVYGHMKQFSVAVAVGDVVECGAHLGLMGSSGHATGPHIHFGVRYVDGTFYDPFVGDCANPPSYWVAQGDYLGLPAATCDPAPPPWDGGPPVIDGGVRDAGVSDGGVSDGGVSDGGVSDGGVSDGGVSDGGARDGGVRDAGVSDAGVSDAGASDGGASDGGSNGAVADGGRGGGASGGCGVAEGASGSLPWVGAWLSMLGFLCLRGARARRDPRRRRLLLPR